MTGYRASPSHCINTARIALLIGLCGDQAAEWERRSAACIIHTRKMEETEQRPRSLNNDRNLTETKR